MKLVNIYFARHPEDHTGKLYMFKAPLNATIHKGVAYAVETKLGQKKVIAFTDNITLSEEDAEKIKPVVGVGKLADTIGEIVPMIKTWEDKA